MYQSISEGSINSGSERRQKTEMGLSGGFTAANNLIDFGELWFHCTCFHISVIFHIGHIGLIFDIMELKTQFTNRQSDMYLGLPFDLGPRLSLTTCPATMYLLGT